MSPSPAPQPAPRAVSASGCTSCPRLLETQNEDLCPGAHPAAVVPPPIPLARVGCGPLQRRPGSEFPGVPLPKGSPLHPARPSLEQTVSFGEDACSLKRHQRFTECEALSPWLERLDVGILVIVKKEKKKDPASQNLWGFPSCLHANGKMLGHGLKRRAEALFKLGSAFEVL